MRTSQRHIDTDVAAIRLLLIMRIFQGDERNRVAWTIKLFSDVTGRAPNAIITAVNYLERREYIAAVRHANGGCVYYLSTLGEEYLEGSIYKPAIGGNHQFRDEVLTGLRAGGNRTNGNWQRSRIDNGVLPGNEDPPCCHETPERLLSRQEIGLRAKQREAARMGIGLDEFDRRCIDGSIQVCDRCGNIGVFHRKNKDRWHSACRDCRRKENQKGKRQ